MNVGLIASIVVGLMGVALFVQWIHLAFVTLPRLDLGVAHIEELLALLVNGGFRSRVDGIDGKLARLASLTEQLSRDVEAMRLKSNLTSSIG